VLVLHKRPCATKNKCLHHSRIGVLRVSCLVDSACFWCVRVIPSTTNRVPPPPTEQKCPSLNLNFYHQHLSISATLLENMQLEAHLCTSGQEKCLADSPSDKEALGCLGLEFSGVLLTPLRPFERTKKTWPGTKASIWGSSGIYFYSATTSSGP
jgi:hypothetical protein